MSSSPNTTIDTLLEHYLGLVDEYTRLRAHLSRAQHNTYHALARARFTADRGARYGPDQFDERMQASRHVVITTRPPPHQNHHHSATTTTTTTTTTTSASSPSFATEPALFTVVAEVAAAENGHVHVAASEKAPLQDETKDEHEGQQLAASGTRADDETAEKRPQQQQQQKNLVAARDPLRWFGLLVPQALRDAQRHSVTAVEDIIPRLASVNAEMAQVEIEVRRAKKKRAKAAAAATAANKRPPVSSIATAPYASLLSLI